ncbi:sulfatase [Rubritalea tangerina]|uniref:Sulfatase n=1 Tax=Rubritalea tangerina TaxID=430798 RepID=A0ABW4Z6R4_9BACT
MSKLCKWIFLSCWVGCGALAAERPNILFIMTDDQAAWSTGYSGNADAHTPALDAFRKKAAELPNTFVNSPVCSPSRASMITSRYPSELGIMEYGHAPLPTDLPTWPSLLQRAGYHTGLVGKWHLGSGASHPTKVGYDYFMGFTGGGTKTKDPKLEVNGKQKQLEGYTVDLLTDDAIRFIEKRPEGKPFMLSLHYRAPHGAYLPVSDAIWKLHEGRTYQMPDFPELQPNLTKMMRGYSASVSHLDWNFGRLMKKLSELGLEEETVVIFTSDHGYNIGHHGATHKGNGDWGSKLPRSYHHRNLDALPGKKMPNMWDTSLRPPHLVYWPGVTEANSRIDGAVNFVDFYPTVCEMAGVRVPDEVTVRGRSFVPLLKGEVADEEWVNPLLIQHDTHLTYVLRGYRTKQWKIIRCSSHDYGFLYDLEKDPDERKNLYELPEYRSKKEALEAIMREKMMEIGDPLYAEGPYPFTKKKRKK